MAFELVTLISDILNNVAEYNLIFRIKKIWRIIFYDFSHFSILTI